MQDEIAESSNPPSNPTDPSTRKVQQPKPSNLGAARTSTSAVLVSPRQKGNPVLDNVRSVGWEYSDIPADFVLGQTTCALFLSLKYHRLHPEYIYTRISALGGRYGLRIVLVMVDIENHEDPLKELTKTSLINNVTILLAWSAQEAGRYLELYKTMEHAAPTSIKGIQATTYSDQLVNFVTVPRGINKTDAVSLVSNFGSVRTAVNARPEEIALIGGWGDKKVQRWCDAVRQPFRLERAGKRGLQVPPTLSRDVSTADAEPSGLLSRESTGIQTHRDAQVAARLGIGKPLPVDAQPVSSNAADADKRPDTRIADDFQTWEPGEDEELALAEMELQATSQSATLSKGSEVAADTTARKRVAQDEDLTDSMAAALSKLRKS